MTYAIAWTEFFDNSIEVLIREGKDEVDVMRKVFKEFFLREDEPCEEEYEIERRRDLMELYEKGSIEDIRECFWNVDENISDPVLISQ